MKKKIVIAGGSGTIGVAVAKELVSRNYAVIILSRKATAETITTQKLEKNKFSQTVYWDGKNIGKWKDCLQGSEAIICLTGVNISAQRWSKKFLSEVLLSRVEPLRVLYKAIESIASEKRPKALLAASATGIYGNDELATICKDWEAAANKFTSLGLRVVNLRTSLVLDKSPHGALSKLILPAKLFLGGPFLPRENYSPWIHIEDEAGAICFILETEKIIGPVDLTAPEVPTNKEFSATLAKVLHRPDLLAKPRWLMNIVIGGAAKAIANGVKVLPDRLLQSGYRYKFPKLESALRDLVT